MADLATKAHIDLVEAPAAVLPGVRRRRLQQRRRCSTSPTSASIADRNGNGVADPEDLILDPAHANGVDDDHDGYVDDISGWDFLYGDNDPLRHRRLRPRHGRGQGLDRRRERHRQRRHLPGLPVPPGPGRRLVHRRRRSVRRRRAVRARPGRRRRSRRRSAAISNPRQAQQAIDAAYRPRGGGRRVDGRRGEQAPEPAGVARAHDGRELGDREADRPARTRPSRATSRSTAARTSAATRSCRFRRAAARRRRRASRRAWSAWSRATPRQLGIAPHPGPDAARPATNVLVGRTKSCRSCGRARTTSTSRRRTRSIRPTTSAHPSGNPLIDTVRYPTQPRAGTRSIGYGRVNAYEMLQGAATTGAFRPRR